MFRILCILLLPLHVAGQNLNREVWPASWITVPQTDPQGYGVYEFSKTLMLKEVNAAFLVAVSADNRYILYVNDRQVSAGPARSDLFHWKYRTIDLRPFLHPGKNEIRARVWNFGEFAAEAQITRQTSFILQGMSPAARILHTDTRWRCRQDTRYRPLQPSLIYTYYAAGPGEFVDFTQPIENDTSRWHFAETIQPGVPKGVFDWSIGWMLTESTLPEMEITPLPAPEIRSFELNGVPASSPAAIENLSIPPHSTVTLLLDQKYLVNGFPELTCAGQGAEVSLRYAEALYIVKGSSDWRTESGKGNRNQVEGKRFSGVADVFKTGEGTVTYKPLVWRTWRYLMVEVRTGEAPFKFLGLKNSFTGYPFVKRSAFDAGNPHLDQILETGWRTARLCAMETYMDCPYYEQLQYVGDTRIQGLVSQYMTGDDRLWRNAIEQINQSRMAEGITLSRYPSRNPQQIPTFSLIWIQMLHDYWWYRPDNKFVQEQLQGTRDVLNFFRRHQNARGLLTHLPYWNFTDWADGPGWDRGVAPKDTTGLSAILDLQHFMALQCAARLEEALGLPELAIRYKKEMESKRLAIRENYFDKGKGLFRDTPGKEASLSQHTQALAILAGITNEKESAFLADQLLYNKQLTSATIYFKYYIHQALIKTGKGNLYEDLLEDWNLQLEAGLTTWAEISDHSNSRSDCHAWGSSPNIEFFRCIAGIDSDGPGFSRVKIEPHPGKLTQLTASIPHHKGMIEVRFKKFPTWSFEIILPADLTGKFLWNQQELPLKPGTNRFTF